MKNETKTSAEKVVKETVKQQRKRKTFNKNRSYASNYFNNNK